MTPPRLILASGSPRRRELLTEAGYQFEIIVPSDQAECGICSTGGPAALVAELAYRKAADVASRVDTGLIIAADTIAECAGQILGKPADREHAEQMLHLLTGQEHRVYSGLCLWARQDGQTTGEPEVRVAATRLKMDPLSPRQLAEYLDSQQWEGKAGAFGYQDRLGWVHIIEGSETNVVGLPMELLTEMLEKFQR